jgi:hypothetical protein
LVYIVYLITKHSAKNVKNQNGSYRYGIELKHGLDSCGSEKGEEAGCCEQGNEPLDSTKLGEFLDYIRSY